MIRSFRGERATIVGRLFLARGASFTRISYLTLIGHERGHACTGECPSPTINANHTAFTHDDVTNDHDNAICFVLGDSNGVWGPANFTRIQYDRIHDCGALPPTNYDHGIYVEESYGSRIQDNLIYNNADRGVQLYPHAVHTLIRGNVIDHNGEGVDFSGTHRQVSSSNVVAHNIITNSEVLYNVMSAYVGPVGTGNVVKNNCIGGGAYDNAVNPGGIRFDHSGFRLYRNRLAVPLPLLSESALSNLLSVPASMSASDPCRGMRLKWSSRRRRR